MSELDLSKKLEVGDLIVGECRCDPTKKGIVEVVQFPVFEENNYSCLRFPNGVELRTLGGRIKDYDRTVGGAISFIEEERYEDRHHCNRDYHNWKHIPKSDFTWEIGDVLYGECACTPSKFVVFKCVGDGEFELVDSHSDEYIGVTQGISFYGVEDCGLRSKVRRVISPPFEEYNYTKYTREEWQKRQTSKFIVPGAPYEKQEPKEYRFKKSDYKIVETDKEIRVTPRIKTVSGSLVVGDYRNTRLFDIEEGDEELFVSDFDALVERYKVEQ